MGGRIGPSEECIDFIARDFNSDENLYKGVIIS